MQPTTATARSVPGADHSGALPLAVVAAWLACLILIIIIVVIAAALNVEGGTFQSREGRELVVAPRDAANVRVRGNSIEVLNAGTAPVVLNLAIRPFEVAGSGFVMVDTAPLPRGAELALLWVRRTDPGEIHEQILKLERDRVVPTLLDGNPEWRGEVVAAAVGVKNASGPVLISEVRLRPTTLRAVLADMVRDWEYFSGWDGRSINVAFGGRDDQRAYLPPLVALAALLVMGASAFTARRHGRRIAIAWLVVPLIAGWILLDVRWQRQLLLQLVDTRKAFAHKTLAERHAAMEHPAFLELVATALRRLPPAPARVFVTSDFDYFRLRAGYYLYPHNVLAFDWADPGVLHSGDYLLMFAKHDVAFDGAHGTLRWSDGREVAVSALIPGQGQGLYQVR
jgi:hypothetical protein